MANQDIITQYEALFAVRTGLTIMLPRLAAFDGAEKTPPAFTVSPESPQDIVITGGGRKVLLKGLRKEHLEASVNRGFIMFYEMEDDDVVRSTLCHYSKG
jgi:hypothetical protein